jgi:hypothetical protein
VGTVGVRLGEALEVPSWDEVHVRISSGSLRSPLSQRVQRDEYWRGALGDIHLSGDISRTCPAYRLDRTRMRSLAVQARAREMAEYTMTGLTDRSPKRFLHWPKRHDATAQ